jgi:hypothetical protein
LTYRDHDANPSTPPLPWIAYIVIGPSPPYGNLAEWATSRDWDGEAADVRPVGFEPL